MNRKAFMAEVHQFAAKLGGALYDLVEGQSGRARAAALEIARRQLRSEIEPEVVPPERKPRRVAAAAAPRTQHGGDRARPRCTSCGELGHNARRHRGRAPASAAVRATAEDESADEEAEAPVGASDSPVDDITAEPDHQAPPQSSQPHQHRVLRRPHPSSNVPMPGWTAEADRREEYADLSMLTTLRKTG